MKLDSAPGWEEQRGFNLGAWGEAPQCRSHVELLRSKLAVRTGAAQGIRRAVVSRAKTETSEEYRAGLTLPCTFVRLADVVLLPVQCGVGLDDNVFVRGLFEFVDQHGFARF